MPHPEDTVAIVELFYLSNFTTLEPDFSGNSQSWSLATKFKYKTYWIIVYFPIDNTVFAIPWFEAFYNLVFDAFLSLN